MRSTFTTAWGAKGRPRPAAAAPPLPRRPPPATPPAAAGGGGVSGGRRASLGRSVRLGRGTRADRVAPRSAAGRGGGSAGVRARRGAPRSAARGPGRPDRSSVAGAAGGRGSRPGAAGGDRREAELRLGADGAGAARPRRPRQRAAVRMRVRGADGRGFASMLVARGARERAMVEALRGDRGGRDGDDRARRGRAREGVVGIPPPGLGRRLDVAQRREGDDQIEPMTEGGEPSVGGGAGVLGTGEHVFVRLGRRSDGRGWRARRLAPLSGIPRPTAIGRISPPRKTGAPARRRVPRIDGAERVAGAGGVCAQVFDPSDDQTSIFVRTRAMTSSVNSVVEAWPPRSGVRTPDAVASSTLS